MLLTSMNTGILCATSACNVALIRCILPNLYSQNFNLAPILQSLLSCKIMSSLIVHVLPDRTSQNSNIDPSPIYH